MHVSVEPSHTWSAELGVGTQLGVRGTRDYYLTNIRTFRVVTIMYIPCAWVCRKYGSLQLGATSGPHRGVACKC